ncbi:MAG: arylesterase [Gemmatimonas sp.]|nr:arylesterase [Gemmatimonas sp.]
MIGCGGPERNTNAESRVVTAEPPSMPVQPSGRAETPNEDGVVLFIGTSLTAGLGLPEDQAFPAAVQAKIDEADLPFRVVNAGVSGETSAGALSRVDWLLRQPFDVVVLETGANDMLRGTDPSFAEQNIEAIVERIRAQSPVAPIILAGMLSMPNLGPQYARQFEAIYPRLAEEHELVLIPFLLEGVAGVRELNQSDGAHPTAEGQRIVANTVWRALEPILRAEMAAAAGR